MGINYAILYHKDVLREDTPRLSKKDRVRVKKAIEEKLETAPETFGKPLRRSLKGYRKLRSGDYRIIFRIEKRSVKIFVIQHRSVVYKQSVRRI
ncbi:type II toxin-antitoxin system RelE/ParE family toxin [Patescibacteria group bacterium]|nr:type II toxin-antitoxin system RelE/ParE family toxin [Patescibacteria group bacterium]